MAESDSSDEDDFSYDGDNYDTAIIDDELFGVKRDPFFKNEIDFDQFRLRYYPHFPAAVTKKYDALFMWTEIQGFIKGSTGTIRPDEGCEFLNEASYIALAKSRLSNINETERKMIFNCFLTYERQKFQKSSWDLHDLVRHILNQRTAIRQCAILDYVFVDEVQDLTPLQIFLFRYICRNPDGFVFAGDTGMLFYLSLLCTN
jgi:hypothetical protein